MLSGTFWGGLATIAALCRIRKKYHMTRIFYYPAWCAARLKSRQGHD
jgi:hypothetical protein